MSKDRVVIFVNSFSLFHFTCDSDEASIWRTRTRAEHSSFNNSASALSATLLKPAKTANPISSSFLQRYQAKGDSHPVIKIAFPDDVTYRLKKKIKILIMQTHAHVFMIMPCAHLHSIRCDTNMLAINKTVKLKT